MNLVKELREKKGWSQDTLAEAAAVGRRTIQRIEIGTSQPSPETALALADALGTEPDLILNWSGTRHHLRVCVAEWRSRAPTAAELASVPATLRPLFADYHATMTVHQSTLEACGRLVAEHHRLHEEQMILMAQSSEAFQSFCDARHDFEKAMLLLKEVEARRTLVDSKQHECDAVLDEFGRQTELLGETTVRLAEVSGRLDRELDSYDVFG